ncbi:MAG: ribonuclease VapC [Candidatus Bathyarchaeota archaeon]|nr:ribonuclease VapC [Candidatus Bathyarchaeota archaeon]
MVDTSAFIAGFNPFSSGEEHVTTPQVEEEVWDSMTALRVKTAVESGKLKIMSPAAEFLAKAKGYATSLGDAFVLSETDIQLLALALQLQAAGKNPLIVTDDYSIQNVATKMGLEFGSLAAFGIRRLIQWICYCPACHRMYPANVKSKTCSVCGSELKRKPQKTERTLK